ncbi:MAG: TldD/PmbA family protein [Thermoplasmata archaeon]|nr:TldD/PmbA family protein [Thermoplasmata archaeon]
MTSLRDAEDSMAHALRRLAPHTSYAEVMAQRMVGHSVRIDKSQTSINVEPRLEGAVFRAWDGDEWVEVASSGLDGATLNGSADALHHRLGSDANRTPPPGVSATGNAEQQTHSKRPLESVAVEERLAIARSLYKLALSPGGIDNAIITMGSSVEERLFLSTAGARRWQQVDRSRGTVVPVAMESGKVEYDYLSYGSMGGWEVLDELTEERILETANEAKALLKAGSAPTGAMTVLLDPSTAGTFAHESFGHGTEADQLLRDRSYLKPLLGQMVGPEFLTLVDDGSYPGGWGSIYFDDEGHPAQRTVLVDHGKFVEVLHDRESAAVFHRSATGNTRRADFLSRPFVRMTNTFVEPGDWSLEELLEEAKNGIYLQNCTSGIEDPLGGQMQIKVKKARLIRNGELGPVGPSMALSGKVLDFLKGIRGVGKADVFSIGPGYCGKGHTDLIPAGTGGSYLLSEAVVGPA